MVDKMKKIVVRLSTSSRVETDAFMAIVAYVDKLMVGRKVAWNMANKYENSIRTLYYVLFSCEGARDTEDRMSIVNSGASMHNAE